MKTKTRTPEELEGLASRKAIQIVYGNTKLSGKLSLVQINTCVVSSYYTFSSTF